MSCTTFGDGPSHCRLRPVGGLEVEDDQVGEVGPVLIFAAENEQLVALIQCRGVT